MRVQDLRALPLFDGLGEDQLAELLAGGSEVAVEPGVVLFHEGEPADSWWVLVEGALELVKVIGREETVVAHMDVPGRWAGGFRAWDDQGVYLATGRGVVPGRVLCVPAEVLRRLSDAWFPFGGHLIEGVYRTARSIESTARQRGALLTLGTLAAGLAHEINNPAAAATRAADALGATCDTLLSSLGRLAHDEISPGQFAALDALRLEVVPAAAAADPLDARRPGAGAVGVAVPARRRGGLDAGASAGRGRRRRRVVRPGRGRARRPGAGAGAASGRPARSRPRPCSARSASPPAGSPSWSARCGPTRRWTGRRGSGSEVTDGIESTLVMLGHKLRAGVTVVREYADDVPMIEAYAGELNQVWTNLVDNAVDAMDGSGTLRVSTRLEDGSVVVEVGDSGHRDDAAGRGPGVRGVLHDQGRGRRHRPRPRHRPAHRGRAAPRRDLRRLAARGHGDAGPAAGRPPPG